MTQLPLDGTKVNLTLNEKFGASCGCIAPLPNEPTIEDGAKIAAMIAFPGIAAIWYGAAAAE